MLKVMEIEPFGWFLIEGGNCSAFVRIFSNFPDKFGGPRVCSLARAITFDDPSTHTYTSSFVRCHKHRVLQILCTFYSPAQPKWDKCRDWSVQRRTNIPILT